jgi:hypothetical protein
LNRRARRTDRPEGTNGGGGIRPQRVNRIQAA